MHIHHIHESRQRHDGQQMPHNIDDGGVYRVAQSGGVIHENGNIFARMLFRDAGQIPAHQMGEQIALQIGGRALPNKPHNHIGAVSRRASDNGNSDHASGNKQ